MLSVRCNYINSDIFIIIMPLVRDVVLVPVALTL